jgi:predicted small secreted protein
VQRKAYVPGAVVLLAALLAACTGSSGSGSAAEDSKAGNATTSAPAAQPGKYRTLSDACGAVSHDTLDSLLPGIKQIADQEQRDRAYAGEAAATYNNDRRSGCRWKAESPGATDHLFVDLERVVSYDNTVSDDNRAQEVYATKEKAANLPEPPSASATGASSSASGTATASAPPSPSAPASGSASASDSASPSATETPTGLEPRTLDGLGDEAFLDDQLSTAEQRTVTVVFRTSNVIVTIEYDEQPATTTQAPDSKDMQDKARKLAQQLAGSLG